MLADSVGLALLIVLDTLEPAERLAFVLHDVFGMTFDEIAPIVDRSPVAARQLASRARRRVQSTAPSSDRDLRQQRRVVDAFLAAQREGNFEHLVALLDPDIVLRADGGALASASRVVRGATGRRRSSGGVLVLEVGSVHSDRPGEWQCRPPGATSRRSTLLRDRLHDRQRKNRRDEHPRGPGSTQQARSLSDRTLSGMTLDRWSCAASDATAPAS